MHTLTTFDAVGEPVWLTAKKPMATPFTLPPWTELSIEVHIIIPSKIKYPQGVPVNDCLMWQSPPPTGNDRCWLPLKVGDYARTITFGGVPTGKTGTVRFSFLPSPPVAQTYPFDWVNTPQPLAGTKFWPVANNQWQNIVKTTNSDGIILNRLSYQVGNASNYFDELG